jgi:hypothetical protein
MKVPPNIERMKGTRNIINTPNVMQRLSKQLSSDCFGPRVKYLITPLATPTTNMMKLRKENDQS